MVAEYPDFQFRSQVTLYFGLIMVLIAFWVDIRSRKSGDYAFWLYLFGAIAFWSGLTSQYSGSEWGNFLYLCINLVMIAGGVIISRKVFVILGGIGCAWYLGHLASTIFADTLFFPFALTIIGVVIIFLGTLWQKNEVKLTKGMRKILPQPLRELLEARD